MKIDQIIDEFNHLEQKDKAAYIDNLQKKADNGDMTALFLTGYLQFPPDWEVMKKASSNGDPELYYNYGNLYQYLFDRNSDCFCLKISE